MEAPLRDLRVGLRGLVRSPGFAAVAVVTLALGIGATSAIFSVVRAVLLAPLPYADPGRRVVLWNQWVGFDKTWLADQEVVDYRTELRTLTDVAAWDVDQQNLTGGGDPVRVGVGLVTANAFDVLGSAPILGRTFSPDEDVPNGPPVVVMGYQLWHGRFGADRAIVGRTVTLDDVPYEVVGVMAQGFRLPTDFTEHAAEPTELWRPMGLDMARLERGSHGLYAVGVLAPGQTAVSATDELRALTRRKTEEGLYPEAMHFSAFAVPVDQEIRGGVRPALWILSGAVLFLLLIACSNVANLLLVRGESRVREMALRTAIGAEPGRLFRQLLAESLLLGAGGALVGLAVAAAGLGALAAVDPDSLPPLAPVTLDWTVVAFAVTLALATSLVFGLAPAMHVRNLNLVDGLREGNQQATIGRARQRLRSSLVISAVALAVVLVVGAGLMARSLTELGRVDLGFRPSHVLTLRLAVPAARYDTPERVVDFYRDLLSRVRAMPGVQSAGVVRALPLATTIGDWGLDIEGYEERPGANAKGDWQIASDGAFEAMGMRLVRGRAFDATDTSASPLVAVINETMARTYWRDGRAVGGRIRLDRMDSPWVQVVGIVADERHNGVTGLIKEKFYIPHAQWHLATHGNLIRNAFVVVRTVGDPLNLAGPVRREVHAIDGTVPVANVRSMDEVVGTALATPRLTGFLLGAFAIVALVLAAVGLYGLLAYVVSRRTHEIGIRLALGADRWQVVRLILGQGLVLTAAGLAIGIAAAMGLTRLMGGMLYEVTPADPWTYGGVVLVLLVVSVVASGLPVLGASRVNPLVVMKIE
ncbi:MAG TPA: ABC transporter permease [Vicinamibacterales bacterium]|nr:ABC transporter permease [Vicinamibacterales bacterium]